MQIKQLIKISWEQHWARKTKVTQLGQWSSFVLDMGMLSEKTRSDVAQARPAALLVPLGRDPRGLGRGEAAESPPQGQEETKDCHLARTGLWRSQDSICRNLCLPGAAKLPAAVSWGSHPQRRGLCPSSQLSGLQERARLWVTDQGDTCPGHTSYVHSFIHLSIHLFIIQSIHKYVLSVSHRPGSSSGLVFKMLPEGHEGKQTWKHRFVSWREMLE